VPRLLITEGWFAAQIWLESKKRLPEYMEQKPANAPLRSQLRLYR
jgi:hypothetical protein